MLSERPSERLHMLTIVEFCRSVNTCTNRCHQVPLRSERYADLLRILQGIVPDFCLPPFFDRVGFQMHKWQWSHILPSLQPFFFEVYLQASAHVWGWPIEPTLGEHGEHRSSLLASEIASSLSAAFLTWLILFADFADLSSVPGGIFGGSVVSSYL